MAFVSRFPSGKNKEEVQLVNYTMLYDQGDECMDITGGWGGTCANSDFTANNFGMLSKESNSFSGVINDASSTANYCQYRCTTNLVNLKEYAILTACCSALSITGNAAIELMVWDTNPSLWDETILKLPREYNILTRDISMIEWGYITVSIATSFVDVGTISANVNEIFLVKEDNWQKWISEGGYTTDDYATLEDVLADTTALETLMNNKGAVDYMIYKCTGTVMARVIQSNTALKAIRDSQYNTLIYVNAHWNKFLRMVGEIPEIEKTYLYKNGDECTDITGGWGKKTITSKNQYYTDKTHTISFTMTKNADNINAILTAPADTGISGASQTLACIGIANKIILDNYTKL